MKRVTIQTLLSLSLLLAGTNTALGDYTEFGNVRTAPEHNARFLSASTENPRAANEDHAAALSTPIPEVFKLLNHPDQETRLLAAATVALFGETGQAYFLAHLESAQPTGANEILPHLRFTSAAQTHRLVRLFSRDLDGLEVALRKNVMLWGPNSYSELMHAYFNGTLDKDTAAAAFLDAGIEPADYAARYLSGRHAHLSKAISLAGAIGNPVLLEALDALYKNANQKTQVWVVTSLRQFPFETVESLILDALNSGYPGVRAAAITSLGFAPTENSASHLLKMLDLDTGHRYEIVQALGQLRSAEAVPSLQRLFVYGDHRLKKEILNACHRIRTPQAVSILVDGATDFDAAIRHQAAELLSTDPRAL